MSALLAAWLFAVPSRAVAEVISGTFAGPILAGGTATLVNGASIVGNITNDGTLEIAMTDNLPFTTYSISGSGNLLLSGSLSTGGTVTLSANNTYSGEGLSYGTMVRYGTLSIVTGGSIDHAGADLFVGYDSGDAGFLTISGGSVTTFNSTLGNFAGSTGTAEISAGSWSTSVSGTEGDLNVGYEGTGTLTMTGGAINAAGSMLVARGTGSLGTFTISGGTAAVHSVVGVGYGGAGSLTMTGGLITSEDGYIGYNAGASGNASITSGTWAISRDLKIATFGDSGVLDINSGGVVTVGGELTRDATNGVLNLNGGGRLSIGVGGTSGSLVTDIVNDGTLVFNRSTDYQHDYLISGTGAVVKEGGGTLTLTQVNSYTGGTTILGGTIAVSGTGAINHPSADMVIGSVGGDVGGLSVAGFVSSLNLDVYNGTFTVEPNGLVQTTGSASIGNGGTGTATVSNGVWSVANDLLIGVSGGTGTLDITGGSALVTTLGNTTLGAASGDSGSVTVSDSAVWNSYGNLAVGVSGTGSLTISTGGTVLVTGTLSQGGAGSTITVDSTGTLLIGSGTTAATLSATSVTNDGQITFNAGSFNTSSPAGISGTGGVTKQGTGALTLSGSSSYTGATSVEAGSLYLTGHLGAGRGVENESHTTVSAGALFGGSGVTEGLVEVRQLATISPGTPSSPIATLTVGSLYIEASGTSAPYNHATTIMTITGTVAGVSYDQIAAFDPLSSPLDYGGVLDITLSGNYADYTTFDLFSNFSAVSGNFSEVVLNAAGTDYADLSFVFNPTDQTWETDWTQPINGQKLVFSLETGDLVVVPEPGTLALAATGALALIGLGRMRRRAGKRANPPGDAGPRSRPT